MYKRAIESYIREIENYYPIIAIIGPRQSGKTTLSKKLFSQKKYVNLESGVNRDFAENDPINFLNQYKSGAIFDEVQNVPDLISELQVIVDEQKVKGQFVLTGSYNFKLLEIISQSLAGRVGIVKLLPLTISELEADKNINELIITGLYPGLHENNIPFNIFFENYIDTYVEKDIRRIENIKNLITFRKFIKLIAGRVGSLINISSLANDVDVSSDTINRWIDLLEASYIIFKLPPWFSNTSKRLIKQAKIYFYDTGLLCNLLGITRYEYLNSHPLYGNIFENFQILEVKKLITNSHYNSELYFYRSYDGKEVDLIIEYNNMYNIVEIKSAHTFKNEFIKGIKSFSLISDKKINFTAVCLGGNDYQKRSKFSILPANKLYSIIEEEVFNSIQVFK